MSAANDPSAWTYHLMSEFLPRPGFIKKILRADAIIATVPIARTKITMTSDVSEREQRREGAYACREEALSYGRLMEVA
jgi:hypothetical protein